VAHLLQGAHSSLTKGYHYTVRDFKLRISVCVAGSIDNMTMRENLLLLRESIATTLRAASFPNRVCTADDLINWCALFCNPHRIEASRLAPLHYDDGREIRDQIIDFDTLQEAKPLGLVFDHRRAVVFLAADPGAAVRAGLSRRPRGGASDRDEPLAAILAAGQRRLLGRQPRQGMARHSRLRPAPLRYAGWLTQQPPPSRPAHAGHPVIAGLEDFATGISYWIIRFRR